MTPITLRPYQLEAVNAVESAWMDGVLRPGVVMATGLGKTFPAAELALRARRHGRRTVFLVHDEQLVGQFAASVGRLDPDGERVGVVVAARDDYTPAIVAATFQTLRTDKRREAVGPRDLVITDECHHAPAKTFHEVLAWFGAAAGGTTRAVGFTATMTRADGKVLGDIWEKVVFERDLMWAVSNGFLVPPRGLTVRLDELDGLADIGTAMGDYKPGELSEVVARAAEGTADAVIRHASDGRAIVFAADVEHAHTIAKLLTERGMPAKSITGKTKQSARAELFEEFTSGRIRALVNPKVLTEGVDLPVCDTVVLARPTRSPTLYCQMVGRALRQHTDPDTGAVKDSALILDLVGTIRDNALVTVTDLFPGAPVTRLMADGSEDTSPVEPRTDPAESAREYADGVPELVDIDLFARASSLVWLSTDDGVVFTPMRNVKGGYVFLWPPKPSADSEVAVGRVLDGRVEFLRHPDGRLQTGMPGEARMRAEWPDILPDEAKSLSRASWRRGRTPPSPRQAEIALANGVNLLDHPTKRDLSDALSTLFAGRMFRRRAGHINEQYRTALLRPAALT